MTNTAIGASSPSSPAPGRPLVSRLLARMTEALLPGPVVTRMRTRREWLHWVDGLTAKLLDNSAALAESVKKELFRRHVTLVEIETHAKCNRICSFCPNAIEDRRTNEIRTDAAMLDRVFDELGSIDYRRQIKVARYSEPLTNLPYLYDRLASARRRVPHAELAVVTNTDYLKRPVLDELRRLGLNVLYMSLYLRDNERWSLPLAHDYNDRLAKKLGVRILERRATLTSLRCTFEYSGVWLHSSCHNWDAYGTDRGGAIERYADHQRLSPCREPFETFVIDYSGAVMPCCAVRSDLPDQKQFAAANLGAPGASIFDVYAGQLAAWRRSMVSFGPKEAPCATCSHREVPSEVAGAVERQLKRRLGVIGFSGPSSRPSTPPLISIRPAP